MLRKSGLERGESECAQEWMRKAKKRCEKLYGIKMENCTALYKGKGRDREQEEQSEDKNKWAEERGERL